MNPNNGSRGGDEPNSPTPQNQQSAAANVIRSQISALYGDRPVVGREGVVNEVAAQQTAAQPAQPAPQTQTATQPQSSADTQGNSYYQEHTSTHHTVQADQWKAYHTAWQNYYQQYYEAYYTHQQAQQKALQQAETQPVQENSPMTTGVFSHTTDLDQTNESLSKDQALFELRQKLLGTVKRRAQKIRRSRHFVPIVAALSVVLAFLFLQYNQVLFATVNAYVSPGSIDPQNIVIDPSSDGAVSQDPRLIIPKINVDVPVAYDISPEYNSQMDAMQKGLAHFSIAGANSHPGEIGNTVLSGHSSNDLFDGGDYKFIFAQLDKLNNGDTIYANYKGKRYTYVVTKKEVVKPTEVNKLVYPTNKPIMTLITCTPLGTSLNRLLVTAEQVSPDPAVAASAPSGSGQTTSSDANTAIPGASSPTLLERLFGAR